MLSYSDCVGLSELTPEEIAVIAEHEHLPDIVALEMGAVLHGTAAGRQLIRRMIIENSKAACRRGDTRTAAQLGLVLHHFIDTHLDRREAAEQGRREDAATPPIREHVATCLPAMLHQFGIDLASAQERFGSEMRIARKRRQRARRRAAAAASWLAQRRREGHRTSVQTLPCSMCLDTIRSAKRPNTLSQRG